MYAQPIINTRKYSATLKKLRNFFEERGFIEAATQPRLSILAACEDPSTIASFQYSGIVWPLRQTGQMDLEYELLANPDYPGVFCITTSYRQEANPIPGRHDLIFPMFEFEFKGDFKDLITMEMELLEYLGFPKELHNSEFNSKHNLKTENNNYFEIDYLDLSKLLEKKDIDAKAEEKIGKEIADILFLKNFPEYTSPFWNMKRNSNGITANKVDTIMFGMETIGSAERETDPQIMQDRFHSISDGKYAEILYAHFSRARVLYELGSFLDLPQVPRVGGGIGLTRMIRALDKLEELHNTK
jgi:aspartyl/asparaginyl-tRNA synthetase